MAREYPELFDDVAKTERQFESTTSRLLTDRTEIIRSVADTTVEADVVSAPSD
jgi:hypothetical protein